MLAHPVNEEHTRRIGEGAFLDCFIHARHVAFPDDLEGVIRDGLIPVRKPCQGKTQNDEGKPLFHEHCIPPFILHSDPYVLWRTDGANPRSFLPNCLLGSSRSEVMPGRYAQVWYLAPTSRPTPGT